MDDAVKELTDILMQHFWVVDQFEQLIVEKANIFVCKERPDYEHFETDSTPVLYYSKDLGSVTTESEIAKICNVVRSNNASEVLPQSRPLCLQDRYDRSN